jgi:hypothetical protein
MPTYYAAVEDDPLTSGEGSRVFASAQCGTIQGADGKRRRLAFIGDKAFCSACGTNGTITYGSGLSDQRRLVDFVNRGRRQAVGGDIVLCGCAQPPRIIAVHGTSWKITDNTGANEPDTRDSASVASGSYDQQCSLRDGAGLALRETHYTVRMPSGELIHGTTDSIGRTARYVTDGPKKLTFYLGHREPE